MQKEREAANIRQWAVLAVLSVGVFLAGVDVTVLTVAAPAMAAQLRPDQPELLWIMDVYSLTVAAALITCGTLADRFGRRRFVLGGYLVFGLSSVLAAFASAPWMLIVLRTMQGLGTAMFMAATVGIIRTVFTDRRRRAYAIGLWTAGHSIGATVGPVIGGVLVHSWWWGAVFLIAAPFVALGFFAGWYWIPESKSSTPRRWDLSSVALSVLGLAGLVYAMKQAGAGMRWPFVVVIGVLAVTALVGFVRRQGRLEVPLVDLSLLRAPAFRVAVSCVLVGFGGYVAVLFFFGQWLELVRGFSPLTTGLLLMPLAAADGLGAIGSPWVAARWGRLRTIALALFLMAAALIVAAVTLASLGPALIITLLALIGLGSGAVMTLAVDVMMAAAAADRASEAGAIQETSFELGAGLGVAVLGTVSMVVYRGVLGHENVLSPNEIERTRVSVNEGVAVAGRLGPPAQAAVHGAFVAGMVTVCVLIAGGLVLAAVAAARTTTRQCSVESPVCE